MDHRPVRRVLAALCAIALLGAAKPEPTPTPPPTPEQIAGMKMWSAVRSAWGDSNYPRFTTYTVGISYQRDGKLVELHYQTFEDMRRDLVYARAFSAEEEANPKTPHGFNIGVGSLNGEGGIKVTHDRSDDPVGTLALGVNQDYRIGRADREIRAQTDAFDAADSSSLPEIGRTANAAKPDYDVRLAGVATENGVQVAHLVLRPLKDPHQYIIRDLWVKTDGNVVLRARLSENFNQGPLHDTSWLVTYVQIDGAPYIKTETAETEVGYPDDITLKNVTITFSDIVGLDKLPWADQVGLEPHPAITDP
jgi:hypothetical protein